MARYINKDGHGGLNGEPCQGSTKLPSSAKTVPTDVIPNADTSSQIRDIGSNYQRSHDHSSSQYRDDKGHPRNLERSPWPPLMARDSKAARAACAVAFMNILLKLIGYPTKTSSWENLLAFGPCVLAKSSRGGATRDQANIVFKRLCECNKTPALHSIHKRPTRIVFNKKQNSHLAAAVTRKLQPAISEQQSGCFAFRTNWSQTTHYNTNNNYYYY